jgi:hypothetical protein
MEKRQSSALGRSGHLAEAAISAALAAGPAGGNFVPTSSRSGSQVTIRASDSSEMADGSYRKGGLARVSENGIWR